MVCAIGAILHEFRMQARTDMRNEGMPGTYPEGPNSTDAQCISFDCVELARPNVHCSLDSAPNRKTGVQRLLVARPVAV